MGAFSIAFDIVIVGALALPWVLLAIHVFSPDDKSLIKKLLARARRPNQSPVAAVLLFAMTYSLGSAVSRIAQDFLDDDDLHVQVFGRVFSVVALTETGILTTVYCHERPFITQTTPETNGPTCQGQDNEAGSIIFHIHEGALLLKGTDKNERLRQFHDQIMVLRGASFNGFVTFSLCLFWWCRNRRYWLRFAVPFLYLLPGGIALRHHLRGRPLGDPPYMEFTLLALAAAGMYLTLKLTDRSKEPGVQNGRREIRIGYCMLSAFLAAAVFLAWWWSALVLAAAGGYLLWQSWPKKDVEPGKPGPQDGRGEIRPGYLVLAAFLTIAAFLGWWSTEVLYDQQVIYSYTALSGGAAKAASGNATN